MELYIYIYICVGIHNGPSVAIDKAQATCRQNARRTGSRSLSQPPEQAVDEAVARAGAWRRLVERSSSLSLPLSQLFLGEPCWQHRCYRWGPPDSPSSLDHRQPANLYSSMGRSALVLTGLSSLKVCSFFVFPKPCWRPCSAQPLGHSLILGSKAVELSRVPQMALG